MRILLLVASLLVTCAPLVAQTSDGQDVKVLQERINAEERLRKKQQKEREKAARNLRPTATINAAAKTVRAFLVREMTSLGWTLSKTDDLTLSFVRPTDNSKLLAYRLGAAMGGNPDVKYINDLVRFTTVDLDKAVTVTIDTGAVRGDTFKDTTDLGPSRDGRFNLEMQDLLDRVKTKAEGESM